MSNRNDDPNQPSLLSETPAYSGPFPGSFRTYFYFVGDDKTQKHDHSITFRGDKFVKLPYGSKENVIIFDVNDPSQAPFLKSIGEEKWPRGFHKEEGTHRIRLVGLYPSQDLLKFIGLGPPKVPEDDSEDEGDSSDDDMNYECGDEMD